MKKLIFLAFLGTTICSVYGQNAIKLPKPDLNLKTTLMSALGNRKTIRDISSKKISNQVLSNILWAAFGINRDDGGRTAPSAMNTQNITIYVALDDGVYSYNALDNTLEKVRLNSTKKNIKKQIGFQDFISTAPIVLIYVADLSKSRGTNTSRIYYAAMNTGYISQNVYLYCSANKLATVAVGWIKKDDLRKILKLDKNQKIMLAQPIGYPE